MSRSGGWAGRLKWLGIGVGVAALLAGAAYWALLRSFPPQRVAALLSEQLSTWSGRSFAILGRLDYRLLPQLAVVAEDLTLANAPWGSRPQMLHIERATLQLRLRPLLEGRVQFERVALDGVELLLETDAKGIGNWNLPGLVGREAPSGNAPSSRRGIAIETLRLANAQLTYRDGIAGQRYAATLRRLELERESGGHRVEAEVELQRQLWQIDARIDPLEALLANQAEWPFDLKLRSDGASIGVAGRLSPGAAPRSGRFELDARVDRPAALAPWTDGSASVPLPIALQTTLLLNGNVLRFEPFRLSLAGQTLSGSAVLRNGDPWQLQAKLDADTLDLRRWLPPRAQGGAAARQAKQPLFGDTPLPFDALPRGQARFDLRVGQLQLPQLPPLTTLRAGVNLRSGKIEVEPLDFGLGGGQVHGSVALTGGTTPRLNLRLDAAGVSLEALARAAEAGGPIGGGRLQLKASLALTGRTARSLAASATGDALLSIHDVTVGEGAMPKLLPELLRAITQRDLAKSTTVQCAVVRLPLQNGLARVDRSIAVETPDLAISASGQIDLREQTMELAFRPTPRAVPGLNAAPLASLVVAKGPLIDPKLSLDAMGAAGVALSIGAAVASGGWSAVGKNLLKQTGDLHPCLFAATGVAAPAPVDSRSLPSTAPTSPQKALPDLLRRIFK